MAEYDQNNDEYKFVELDGLDNNMMDDMSPNEPDEYSSTAVREPEGTQKNIKRNALIAIIIIVLLMVMYQFFGSFFTGEEIVQNNTLPVTEIAPQPPVQQQEKSQTTVVTPVITQPIQAVAAENYSDLTKKVNAMDLSQQSVRSEVSNVSQQVGAVNNNISNLNNEIANLNQVIKNLSLQLIKQSEEINILMARTQPKKIVKHHIKLTKPPLIYHIQAVIPGRAWLIASNGSTFTVREGTKLAGYGVVKLIDPLQGRVITSSGQVIKFSQEDS